MQHDLAIENSLAKYIFKIIKLKIKFRTNNSILFCFLHYYNK